jgi:metaxin
VPLYAQQSTRNGIVQTFLSHSLRSSALQELHKSRPGGIVPEDIYADAAAAWEALSAALGPHEWFLGRNEPGWLDASVFAYTHLVATALRWCEGENQLARSLLRYGNLLRHEERVRGRCGW